MNERGADRRRNPPGVFPPGFKVELERRRADERRRNGFISCLQLFASIPYEAVESVLSECELREVLAGEVLLEPGQHNHAIQMLVTGRLRIHLDAVDSAEYVPIEEGGCFGELSIIDGRPVSAWVVADRDSRVLSVHEDVFWNRLIPHPGVARNLLNVLSERMRMNRDLIVERVRDRMALEQMRKELGIARDIQLSMLPFVGSLTAERPEVDAWGLMEPATDVGGDFYDGFFASPERLFVAVGDVSGKGVPAALFMARAITQLRMEAVRKRSPSAILESVNRALCAGNDAGMFVTLFCGVLDTATGQFSYANAGHNPPVFLPAGGGAEFLKVRRGLVSGIIDTTHYLHDTIQLSPGDALLLYTDGVTEAMDPSGGFYGDGRLLARLASGAWAGSRALVDHVRGDVAEFAHGAPQADDITLLALRFRTDGEMARTG